MLLRKIVLTIVTLTLFLPSIAQADDINVKAGNVRVTTRDDGTIRVNTGGTNISVPANGSSTRVYRGNSDVYSRTNDIIIESERSAARTNQRRIYKNGRYNVTPKKSVQIQSSQRISCSSGRTSTRQTTKVTGSGRRVIQSNVNVNSCR